MDNKEKKLSTNYVITGNTRKTRCSTLLP